MRDVDLYRHLLGLASPWTVARVELTLKEQRVDVWAEHSTDSRWACPECKKELPLYDHSEERVWRHLDSCQFMTYLHARPPRVDCPEHGVRQVRLPWAEPRSRFTVLFERLIIDVLKETDVLGATRILRISWDEAFGVMERAVRRGLLAKERETVTHIGIDEKAAAKGHQYVTLVCNLETSTVEYVADGRKQESLDGYFRGLSEEQRSGIQAIAMDMWEPFFNSVKAHVPDAEQKVVFDRFHIMAHVSKAVDDVRRKENRELRSQGDESLSRSKYLWLYGWENLPEKHQERFNELKARDLKTGRAWSLKENLRTFWGFWTKTWAERFWKRWFFWATHSRLKPMIEAARTIQRHLANVLTFFEHRVTNAVSEGINSKIQTIKKRAYGFRNRENFKTAIYFHCGGLSLYPNTHAIP